MPRRTRKGSGLNWRIPGKGRARWKDGLGRLAMLTPRASGAGYRQVREQCRVCWQQHQFQVEAEVVHVRHIANDPVDMIPDVDLRNTGQFSVQDSDQNVALSAAQAAQR